MRKIIKSKIGWKILRKGNKSQYNDFKWRKNKWYKHDDKLIICESGFHASKELVSAMSYLTPGIIAKVEYKGEVIEEYDKFVASEMRVVKTYKPTKKQMVEWSIYCARQCLKEWNKYDKSDKRPLKAIQAAEAWLENPTQKNKSAAKSAALASELAARSAASSSWSVARSAASSSWSASESAARSAASAIWSASESAAWSVASAIWSASESAAKNKLHKKLLRIIKGDTK